MNDHSTIAKEDILCNIFITLLSFSGMNEEKVGKERKKEGKRGNEGRKPSTVLWNHNTITKENIFCDIFSTLLSINELKKKGKNSKRDAR